MLSDVTQELTRYSRRLRAYFVISVALFVAGIVLGVVAATYHTGLAHRLEQSLMDFGGIFRGLSKVQLAGAIFLNNTVKSAAAMLLGVFLGALPVIFLLVNGAALGAVVYLSIGTRGVWQSAMAILPHGILELPAVLCATSIGLMLGSYAVKRLAGKAHGTLSGEIAQAVKFFCAVIVPLLLVAALVEAYLTPIIAKL